LLGAGLIGSQVADDERLESPGAAGVLDGVRRYVMFGVRSIRSTS
jgi:hypothetical protein